MVYAKEVSKQSTHDNIVSWECRVVCMNKQVSEDKPSHKQPKI